MLADAPYASGLGVKAVVSLLGRGGLEPGALAAIETGRGEQVTAAGLSVLAEREVGRARLTILRCD